ncbi:hypothetical protein Prudu_002214 [Prunus dulcis]|uniref:Uncharacterized protein n=1 Tax=Prunus dulcis TaxID=3755 RepID=A0A4Y1QQB4_PRUDU|nr:hypothetical protein Prudu_002214 [Prunus dulcis]
MHAPEVWSTRSRDLRMTWCPETCQDCSSADSVSPRPARIADKADYGPLHPARATRADLVSSRNLSADQTDHSPLISPVCGSGIRAVEVRGIHHRAIHSFRASKSGEKFYDWSKYREDSAEFLTEV